MICDNGDGQRLLSQLQNRQQKFAVGGQDPDVWRPQFFQHKWILEKLCELDFCWLVWTQDGQKMSYFKAAAVNT